MLSNDAQTTKPEVTMLLVDDESSILSSLRRVFRSEGYKILVAESGAEGLTVLEQNSVDLVISDMKMPVMDGAAFLAEVATRWPKVIRILLTGYADLSSTIKAINEGKIYKYLSKPWEDNDLKITVRHALEGKYLEAERNRLLELTRRQNEQLKELNGSLERKVEERTKDLHKAHESLKKSYFSSIKTFSNLVEMREGHATGHSRRVAEHARVLAVKLGHSADFAQQVMFAGLLHDIGKIGLPDQLIGRAFNSLGKEDRIRVARHTVIGEGLLMGFDLLSEATKMVRSHHENYDGSGFPDGLSGADIPMGARILAVVNDYDSMLIGMMTTLRQSQSEALDFISRNKRKRYDPDVVEAFLQQFEQPDVQMREPEMKINAGQLQVGMVLARDLITKSGILVLSEGYILDEKIIEKIHNFSQSASETFEVFVKMRKQ